MNKISFSSRGTRPKETKSQFRLESQTRHLVNVWSWPLEKPEIALSSEPLDVQRNSMGHCGYRQPGSLCRQAADVKESTGPLLLACAGCLGGALLLSTHTVRPRVLKFHIRGRNWLFSRFRSVLSDKNIAKGQTKIILSDQ